MGIPGIYKELGPGQRVALSKIAVEHFEHNGRPLRIAVDASIWSFQNQAGKGGSNPALRTLYYRLLRLLSLHIVPLFVFDGVNKPPFKRNVKTSSSHGASLPDFRTKQLLQLFGFPYHNAPGEAEAECALLQKEGIVDAVLSEDVDTLMFGCTHHLRNWSSENVRGNKVPTHVNVLKPDIIGGNIADSQTSTLNSQGMVLVAIMSGGDYLPAGIPGCGVKTACEAARAGFGNDLCQLSTKDQLGLAQWKEKLEYELQTNESGYFRTRHKALTIPSDFPDRTILRYYTQPAVSTAEQVAHLRDRIRWDTPINVPDLRQFVAEEFEWQHLSGAKKFVRGLAPALLVENLCRRQHLRNDVAHLKSQDLDERNLITAICDRRTHFATDGIPELRIAYTPIDIVRLDLEAEENHPDSPESSDSEPEVPESSQRSRSRSPTKRPSTYDPTQVEKIWVMESYVRAGVPLLVGDWEEDLRNPRKFASRKARERLTVSKKNQMATPSEAGAMDRFVRTTKPGVNRNKHIDIPKLPLNSTSIETSSPSKSASTQRSTPSTRRKPFSKSKSAVMSQKPAFPVSADANPWTLAKRPPDTSEVRLRPGTRYSALGIDGPLSALESSTTSTPLGSQELQLMWQPVTPSSSGSHRRRNSDPVQPNFVDLTTPPRINSNGETYSISQLIDSLQKHPTTPPQSIPSPATLLETQDRLSPSADTQDGHPLLMDKILGQGNKQARALLALRESLDGTWRDLAPWEQRKGHVKTILQEVDTIDLTMS
ncbi:MAG: hypothetical protein Q9222_007745 [Ikaeria aurantiellina]